MTPFELIGEVRITTMPAAGATVAAACLFGLVYMSD
jgi:hypothetical protein